MIISCTDQQDELDGIKTKITTFLQGGEGSRGIILETNHGAKAFYPLLAQEYELQLISPDRLRFVKGVSVTSIQISKGLEFDEVSIPNVSSKIYHTSYDKNMCIEKRPQSKWSFFALNHYF